MSRLIVVSNRVNPPNPAEGESSTGGLAMALAAAGQLTGTSAALDNATAAAQASAERGNEFAAVYLRLAQNLHDDDETAAIVGEVIESNGPPAIRWWKSSTKKEKKI